MVSIKAENRRPGTAGWWSAPHAAPGAIEGYSTQPSVVAGDRLELCVATRPAARYRISVYRLGWYRGDGGRVMTSPAGNIGLARDAPLPDLRTGICRAGWPVTDVITTSESWRSGQYVAVLELAGGPGAGSAARVPFVVRALPGDRAPILVQTPVNTAQAYNHWGGKCLYTSNSTDQIAAVKVSFDRPVLAWGESNLNSKAPFIYEVPLLRWLEREGYEVDYQTDVDTHRDPSSLAGRRLIVSAGHDEYWTLEMRNAVEEALAQGTSLAFMGSNICYWQSRYEDDERTVAVYRHEELDPEADRALQTIKWRDLKRPRPENELLGVQYEGGIAHPTAPLAYAFVPGFADDAWAQDIDLAPERPVERVVGYEWDTLDTAHPRPALVRILHADSQPVPADCVRWTAPSGATVLAAGSLALSWALDDWGQPGVADARVQNVMRRGFDVMLSEAP